MSVGSARPVFIAKNFYQQRISQNVNNFFAAMMHRPVKSLKIIFYMDKSELLVQKTVKTKECKCSAAFRLCPLHVMSAYTCFSHK